MGRIGAGAAPPLRLVTGVIVGVMEELVPELAIEEAVDLEFSGDRCAEAIARFSGITFGVSSDLVKPKLEGELKDNGDFPEGCSEEKVSGAPSQVRKKIQVNDHTFC